MIEKIKEIASEIFEKEKMQSSRYFELDESIFCNTTGVFKASGRLKRDLGLAEIVILDDLNLNKLSSYPFLGNMNFFRTNGSGKGRIFCSGVNYVFILIENETKFELSANLSGFTFLHLLLGKNSKLLLKIMCDEAEKNFLFRKIKMLENSQIKMNAFLLAKEILYSRNECFIGKSGRCETNELFISKGNEKLDIQSSLVHVGKNGFGRMSIRGVSSENSIAVVKGVIDIWKGSKNSDSFQELRAMSLGNSRAMVFPYLEIKENEVKASHSASVQSFIEEHLFYLESRGLERKEAEELLISGFLKPVLEKFGVKNEIGS
jgi:hypothetical protein